MIDTLMINGVDVLSTYHMKADNTAARIKPSRDVETYHIAGRNGDVVIDKGGFNNVTLEYSCVIYENFTQNFNNLISFLYNTDGYVKIVDPSDPDHYRMGMLIDEVVPDKADDDKGTFTLPLFCKPQRFALSGENFKELEYDSSTTALYYYIQNNSGRAWDEAVYRFVLKADKTTSALLTWYTITDDKPSGMTMLSVRDDYTGNLAAGTYDYDLRYGTFKNATTGVDYTDAVNLVPSPLDLPYFVVEPGKTAKFSPGPKITLSIKTNEWEV